MSSLFPGTKRRWEGKILTTPASGSIFLQLLCYFTLAEGIKIRILGLLCHVESAQSSACSAPTAICGWAPFVCISRGKARRGRISKRGSSVPLAVRSIRQSRRRRGIRSNNFGVLGQSCVSFSCCAFRKLTASKKLSKSSHGHQSCGTRLH